MARIVLDDDGELEDYVRRYLEDTVQARVRVILEHQLKNIVSGELARMKLLDPLVTTSMDACIESALGDFMRKYLDKAVEPRVKASLARHYEKLSKSATQ